MGASQPTTTTLPEKPPLFEPPEIRIDERQVLMGLAQEINPQTFQTIIYCNFLMVMAAFDRRCKREYFQEIVVTAFNLQNQLCRWAETSRMLGCLHDGEQFGTTPLTEEANRHMEQAAGHRQKLIDTLQLFQEMRTAEDPVS